MAHENTQGKIVGLRADADLSGAQFRFVMVTGAGTVGVADTAGGLPIGVLLNKPGTGEAAEVQGLDGVSVSKVVAGGSVPAGSNVATDDQGRAVVPVAGNAILGVTLTASSSAGEIISVILGYRGKAQEIS